MPDLKAAAKMMLNAAAATAEEMKVFRSGEWHDQAERERAGFLLAAQALEAWAWQQEPEPPAREESKSKNGEENDRQTQDNKCIG